MAVRSHEGREPVAPARVEGTGARGRGEQAAHSGGVGAPPGGQYGPPARSWLTVRPLRRARGLSGDAVRNDGKPGKLRGGLAKTAPGKRGPTPKENAGRRAEGRHAFARRRAQGRTVASLGAPSPLFSGREAHFQKPGRIRAAGTTEVCPNEE